MANSPPPPKTSQVSLPSHTGAIEFSITSRSSSRHTPTAAISNPSPTMMRNAQNTTGEFGLSCGGNSFRPLIAPSQVCVRISAPRCGISTAQSVRSCAMSGMPNRISGVPGRVSQSPSSAAILAG